MSLHDDEIMVMTKRVYKSMSRQLRAANPHFTFVSCCFPEKEFAGFADDNLQSIVTKVAKKLGRQVGFRVDVSYAPAPHYLFIGIIPEERAPEEVMTLW